MINKSKGEEKSYYRMGWDGMGDLSITRKNYTTGWDGIYL